MKKVEEVKNKKISVVIIGAGGFAGRHVECISQMGNRVSIVGFVEPAEASREKMTARCAEFKMKKTPPFFNTLEEFIVANGGPADCAVIVVPHNLHVSYIVDCLEAGMDVLVEKPMVLNRAEARRAIKARDKTGRLLCVAFPGSFSPAIRKAKELIAAGAIGEMKSMVGYTHQWWFRKDKFKKGQPLSWRMKPEISGGGFLFDTGSHLVNTMIDLAGADVKSLCAVQDTRGAPVEISTAIAGRFKNDIFFTLCAEGNSINCQSGITIMGTGGVLITGMYGEVLRIIKPGKNEAEDIPYEPSLGVFEQFLLVRDGKLSNPCPAEVGLRFAKFMDTVRNAVK